MKVAVTGGHSPMFIALSRSNASLRQFCGCVGPMAECARMNHTLQAMIVGTMVCVVLANMLGTAMAKAGATGIGKVTLATSSQHSIGKGLSHSLRCGPELRGVLLLQSRHCGRNRGLRILQRPCVVTLPGSECNRLVYNKHPLLVRTATNRIHKAMSGLSRVSVWACGPLNLMKISSSQRQNRTGWSGEIEFALEKLRLSACLIRSVRG